VALILRTRKASLIALSALHESVDPRVVAVDVPLIVSYSLEKLAKDGAGCGPGTEKATSWPKRRAALEERLNFDCCDIALSVSASSYSTEWKLWCLVGG
jgi:hypothetical protein